ncbi:MAG TPA: fibronectin type III domain-containing protein [Actinophytocola sp.]|uniref:fibronectin type III domain-containing protein n=1 Tax=Actinophytocola sp. TaxID=1872138 RepID=UPI002DB62401|nr:fibronectin type III domain-containing protein [Actinophytocola sp.]HEU5471021.1 fibronectin type III domain-containing protein [Actinophytocola sp.]
MIRHRNLRVVTVLATTVLCVSVSLGTSPVAAADTTAPPTATMPRVVNVSASQVVLNWTPGQLTEPTRWRVFRNGVLAKTSVGSSYTDANLTPGAWYSYTVVSVDLAGNASAPTRTLTVQTRGPGVRPGGPRELVATDVDPGRVTLSFTVPDDDFDVSGYQVFDGSVLVARTWASSWTGLPATVAVRQLAPGSAHAFSVAAVRTTLSAPTNTVAVTTPASSDGSAPTSPSGLQVTEDRYGCAFADIRWQPATDDTDPTAELDYEVTVDGAPAATVRGQTQVDAVSVAVGSNTVSVRAVDASGNGSAVTSTQHVVDPSCTE